MFRRSFLRRGALLGSAALGAHSTGDGAIAAGLPARLTTYRNPVFARVFPDPTAVRGPDGKYFAYATYHDWGAGPDRRLIPIVESENLVDWSYAGSAFDEPPKWKRYVGFWAPHAAEYGGRYLLYYSDAEFGAPNPGIGVATAPHPTGPFTDRGPVLRSNGIGVENSIDPALFVDDGTPYLFWGSHRGLYGVELAADALSVAGEPFQVAGAGVEAPYLVRRDGDYFLFGSRGTCCRGADSTYRVVVGRASSLRGPYENRAGESLLEASGTTVVRSGNAFAAPGHNAVVTDDAGDDWLLYHAYERGNWWIDDTPRRVLMLDPIRRDEGWPVVPGRTPSAAAQRPTIER